MERKEYPLEGKTVVFTGKFKRMERMHLLDLAERLGARVMSSVSKRTSFVVIGEEYAVEKLERARQMDIPVFSEEDFFANIADYIEE